MINLNYKYKTPVGIFSIVKLENEPAIRLVLTGKCNLSCEFCVYKQKNFYSPEVKSKDFTEMTPSIELEKIIDIMNKKLKYSVVHLTGGEPTLCSGLINICKIIKEQNLRVHMVTNLVKIGPVIELLNLDLLDELTFSYVPNDNVFGKRNETIINYYTVDTERYSKVIENALLLKKNYPNLVMKTNIVISGLTNINECMSFISLCWDNNIEPRLQRDRSSNRIIGSTEAVLDILNKLKMKPQKITLRIPGATEVCEYKNDLNEKLKVKIFNQNFRVDSVCSSCNDVYSCDKALSSIRIFEKPIGPVLAFCTKLDENFAVISMNRFLKSNIYREIKEYRDNPLEYFEKFCKIKNHQ